MITHIQQMRSQYEYNRQQVLFLTGMTDEQLKQFMFETGITWLEHYTNDDREVLTHLLSEKMIWKWWVNEWSRRDDTSVLPMLYNLKPECRLSNYRSAHQVIFSGSYPPYVYLEGSYKKAIGEHFKFLLQQQANNASNI